MDITYWYLFPIGIIIATLSMSAGISGANFWIPVYLFLIKLDPLISFWLACKFGATHDSGRRLASWCG